MIEDRDQAFVVLLHNEPVAQLRVRKGGSSVLSFLDSYVQATPRPVLSQKFEDWSLSKVRRFQSLPPFFQHLLPEGALRKYILRSEHLEDSDVELLRRLGRDLPGALAAGSPPSRPLTLTNCRSAFRVVGDLGDSYERRLRRDLGI